ncbi:ABC transporter permease [Nocardioides daejeonensis]|uniref:ABC transporter permease n=1 Tax=Nocardioides daejeonensis TaxID=1046556 RepID=UPI001951D970|nr:ABC transporter permease [Nocardioides daejeonensis]
MPEPDINHTGDPVDAPVPAAAAGTALLDPGEETAAKPRVSRRTQLLVGAPMLVGGLALAGFAATTALLITLAKVLLLVVGLLVAMNGLGRIAEAVRGKSVDIVFVLGMTWLTVLIGLAVLAPLLPLGNHNDATQGLYAPIFAEPELGSEYPLGTNNYGLDMLARAIYGARTSLVVSLFAILIGTTVGGLIGMVAGFLRGATDRVVGILANALLAVPPLVLLIALGTVLSPNLRNLSIALSLLTIPSMVRVARANTITFAQREFVLAAQAIGATRMRLLRKELLPNVVLPVASMGVVMVSMLIVAEASLSYLGLGIRAPEPTWGNMIAEGEGGVMEAHPFIVIVPGLCLFLTVFSFNLLGEKVQKRWDPRSAKL